MNQKRLAERIAERVWEKIEPSIEASIDLAVHRQVVEYLSKFLGGCTEMVSDENAPTDYGLSPSGKPMVYGASTDVSSPQIGLNSVEYIPKVVETGCNEVPEGIEHDVPSEYATSMTAEDYIERFIDECCVFDENAMTSASELYCAYSGFDGSEPMKLQRFGRCLTKHMDLKKRKIGGNMYYLGIKLRKG